jgi:hypothetical protein
MCERDPILDAFGHLVLLWVVLDSVMLLKAERFPHDNSAR